MTWSRSLRRALLRWDRLVAIGAAALPTLLLSLLGFLWLGEHGLLLPFFGGCIVLAAAVSLIRWWSRRPAPQAAVPADPGAGLSVSADPDWLPAETAVFERVRADIEARTATPQPWEKLPDLALEVVGEVARGLGGRGVLDFTVPEALLLIERTVGRYRSRMRAHVPFADGISIQTMQWLWSKRTLFGWGYTLANAGYRLGRIARNPPLGVMREVEQLVSGGNSSWLSGQMMGVAQAVLLEEVAIAAVELYSGRLRFSDAELLELGLAATEADRARLAKPDAPLRILVVGQTSAGKSTLINALLGADRAETDMAPTTPGLVTHEGEIEGVPCYWVDSRGLDGGEAGFDSLLGEMREADMILWTLRANRPGRAIDQRLLRQFQASFEAEPERHRPEILAVATSIDRLLPGWPFPENLLPPEAQEVVGSAVRAMAQDMDGLRPIPVCAVAPEWNIGAVQAAMAAGLARAMGVQRNRRRILGAARSGGVLQEIGRSGQGLVFGASEVGSRLLGRVLPSSRGRAEGG